MELAHCGTLLTQLRKLPGLSDPEVKFYFANLVLALEFLHTQGIVHSDVKPENLVLGADGYLMLTDFGLAQPLHGATKWTRMGTLEYMSPEIISCEPMDTETKRLAADWWAAAIVLFEMKTREHPFECDNADELIEKHTNAPLRWPPRAHISEEFEDLVSRMLHVDLDHRYGARDVRAGKGGAFINKDVRTHPYMKSINWDRIAMRVAVVSPQLFMSDGEHSLLPTVKAPRVPKSVPDLSNQAHRRPFLDPTKVPGLPVKRPSPRFEHLELTLEKEDSPRKKRRMAGQLSVCLRPSKRSKTALQGSVDGVE
ncbi:hypothetical protein BN946_scf185014.g77 [Trametes cinnabarina]|uniref:cAMP-dependent protein kinase n=1 Tax=Pycnoporus cinnabarinus TaxID=5643 RepID=A0A060SGG0_PYCCI|nr:hypothetical protein BN946_scf185014.g77 [Trametes cinnabarina]